MAISEKLVDSAPGLLGRITKYIHATSIVKVPQLSLASAIATLSILKAHKVRTESNLRTNLLIAGLASSGEGKGHGLRMIDLILRETKHDFLISGKPASDTGLLRSLSTTGKKIIIWDELGWHLKKMTGKNSPSYYANILSVFLDTFSAADTLYRGMEYADSDGKRPRIDIQEPCLTLYGVSAPVRFFQALNSDFAVDGFLPRLLIFRVEDNEVSEPPGLLELQRKIELDQDLILEIKETFPVGELSHLSVNIDPKIVKFEGAATNQMWDVQHTYHKLKNRTKNESEKAVYSRALEHYMKLCLVCNDFCKDSIHLDTAWFCRDLIDALIQESISTLQTKIHDSVVQAEGARILEVIKKSGLASKSVICRATRHLTVKERNSFIDNLLESESIEMERVYDPSETNGHGKRAKPSLFFKIKTL